MSNKFRLKTDKEPKGDQPKAIKKLTEGLNRGLTHQTLLGATGTGKTFTMANVIENVQKPTLVMAHNKTLTAQLWNEFNELFPDNAVHYFVSYYDYYQPEAYVPETDTYIEKDSSINDEIDRLRHKATSALFEREDVIIVASVSCIYGLGSPDTYEDMARPLTLDSHLERDDLLHNLVRLQYKRNNYQPERGTFRVRGDTVEIVPIYGEEVVRVEFFGDVVDRIRLIDSITGKTIEEKERVVIYPATHFITPRSKLNKAMESIKQELEEQLKEFREQDKLLEAQRLERRTRYDLEMMEELGYCKGIENYSRHLTGRDPGEPPYTLIDYFPDDFLIFVDESHQTIPQLGGMYKGDRSRKETLVQHGYRLLSALDNRPLKFEEFEDRINQVIYTSATPGPYEYENSEQIVEQIIRPTGLVDPEVEVRPIENQVDDLLNEIEQVTNRDERVLVTTLTKKLAEELTDYFVEVGIKARYLHSEIDTLDRVKILRGLRQGDFNVLVGINLLREGLDLPEASLVAILDADKEGFLRSDTSLIQTMGRAARNVRGKVVLYADEMTDSMRRAIDETNRRREIQIEYNKEHDIEPETIKKEITDIAQLIDPESSEDIQVPDEEEVEEMEESELFMVVEKLEKSMNEAAERLEFEKAAAYRDEIEELTEKLQA
ncbi:excinuclease ABC subunit UvrB [Candidatus Bipolaricaulota bacterium]|nr:excinuclease ABC subunit UvrB [Candidatus Bipolaricaulota bacterium]MBS3814552.1 excinuclease ABC subunit UvrB [Candidatus Bipolaricaulota bacterium]MBS3825322.1 excinuclease ABC subunit UvrB [Candidatus Bipolaricaulota bacterium]